MQNEISKNYVGILYSTASALKFLAREEPKKNEGLNFILELLSKEIQSCACFLDDQDSSILKKNRR